MLANVTRPGTDFGALSRYLIEGYLGASSGSRRVAWLATRNLASDQPEIAAKIMTATAHLSVRVERPVYHLIVSFHPDEKPTHDAMLEVADETLRTIGLRDHQVLIVGHDDTPNPHMHLMVNRIHPNTGIAWQTSRDYARIERCMQRLASTYGFLVVPGRHAQPESFLDRARRPRDAGYQHARKLSEVPLLPWSAERCRQLGPLVEEALNGATSWHAAEQSVRALGVELLHKGQGLILVDPQRSGFAKLSSLGRQIRLNSLEKRFGQSWRDHMAQAAHEYGTGLSRVEPPPWPGDSEPHHAR